MLNANELLHMYKLEKEQMSDYDEDFPSFAEWKKEYDKVMADVERHIVDCEEEADNIVAQEVEQSFEESVLETVDE